MAQARQLKLEKKYIDCYPYAGHHFNGQKAERYIFRLKRLDKPIEASAYQQQLNGKTIKVAIELSSMFSCPMGCKFCASGSLGKVSFLTVAEILEQGKLIAKTITKSNLLHFCFQGIGEPSLISANIIQVAKKLLKLYPKAKFKVSTMGCNPQGIVELADNNIPWEAMQITLPHYQEKKLKEIFTNASQYNLKKVLSAVSKIRKLRPEVRIKFNYVCIKGFNDNKKTIKGVVNLLRRNNFFLNDETELKISYLNPTDPAEYFKLEPVKAEKHYELLRYAQKELGVKNVYVFGAMKNIRVGCGQLIKNNTN